MNEVASKHSKQHSKRELLKFKIHLSTDIFMLHSASDSFGPANSYFQIKRRINDSYSVIQIPISLQITFYISILEKHPTKCLPAMARSRNIFFYLDWY